MGANCLARYANRRSSRDSRRLGQVLEQGDKGNKVKVKVMKQQANIVMGNRDTDNVPLWVAISNKLRRSSFVRRRSDDVTKPHTPPEQLQPLIKPIATANADEAIASPLATLTAKETVLSEEAAPLLVSPLGPMTSSELITPSSAPAVDPPGNTGRESTVTDGVVLTPETTVVPSQDEHYSLQVVLKEGKNLAARDSNGFSDPFCVFVVDGKELYRSSVIKKNLNPRWDEVFVLLVKDLTKPFIVKVFDHDRFSSNDLIGQATLHVSTFELNTAKQIELKLEDPAAIESDLGCILLTCTLQLEQKDFVAMKKPKNSASIGIVTILLVEGNDLLPMDENGFSDPYVEYRLGKASFKSKHKEKTLAPRWLEQGHLPLHAGHTELEIIVWDHDLHSKDDVIGRASLDLTKLEKEKTHSVTLQLTNAAYGATEPGSAGFVTFLVTMTATFCDTSADLVLAPSKVKVNSDQLNTALQKYAIRNTSKAMKDIGWLQVKVIKADGLASADIGGKSDPFCILELVNLRVQTPTVFNTLQPVWGRCYQFDVKDIHETLEVTLYDEDRAGKDEFLGRVLIPLLTIRNGEKRWYQLKDRKCLVRVKGAILLEMEFAYNPIRAALRTLNPRETKYIQHERKLKLDVDDFVIKGCCENCQGKKPYEIGNRLCNIPPVFVSVQTIKRHVRRIQQAGEVVAEGGKFVADCFSWRSKPKSTLACLAYCLLVWYFHLCLIPLVLFILFVANFFVMRYGRSPLSHDVAEQESKRVAENDDEDDEEDMSKRAGKTRGLVDRLQTLPDLLHKVQDTLEMIVVTGERLKNAANFTVPWLSWLAVIAFAIAFVVLYLVPLRVLLLAWGINKFSKKLRSPNYVDNNELLDYLSRVPSDNELMMYYEFRPDPGLGSSKLRRV